MSNVDYRPELASSECRPDESRASKPPMRFFLEQRGFADDLLPTVTRLMEGVLWRTGQVTIQHPPPMTTVRRFKDFDLFLEVYVTHRAETRRVVFVDAVRVGLLPKSARDVTEFCGGRS